MSTTFDTRELMSQTKFLEAYSRDKGNGEYESWKEAVSRVMDMHRTKYANKMTPELETAINEAQELYTQKAFLGSQRALQFGGEQLLDKNAKMFNCVASYADRPKFFSECFELLLCGCGTGFSVQWHHVDKLSALQNPNGVEKHVIEDSIEGWADAAQAELDAFFFGFPLPEFDPSKVRKKGSFISGGFKAPGPEPLMKALRLIRKILQGAIGRKLKPIEIYDIVMHLADAVLAGGVRRAATICLFSPDDVEMMEAKTGNWFKENPQRGRSNNSAVLLKKTTTFEQFKKIIDHSRQYGDPGIVWVDSLEQLFNPCVEIGLYAYTDDGESGWQGCNLCEISGLFCDTEEKFYSACRAAAIVGTLQAGYTDFGYLTQASKDIFEREALLGVSITGFMNNPQILLNPEILEKGASIVLECNKQIAKLIGINPAARTTCVKPSGNASVLLGCAPSTQGEHAKHYLRHVQYNAQSEAAKLIQATNPNMVEPSVYNDNDVIVAYPITPNANSKFRQEVMGVNQLENVKLIQKHWVGAGKDKSLCVDENLSHNVSNTITVDDWNSVLEYIYNNREHFAGIALLDYFGDRAFFQAPMTEVLMLDEIATKYNLNDEFDERFVKSWGQELKQYDWADLTNFQKDVYLLAKWMLIEESYKEVDWSTLPPKEYVDIDTMGAVACSFDPKTGMSNCA